MLVLLVTFLFTILFGCLAITLLVPWMAMTILNIYWSVEKIYGPLEQLDYLLSWIWFMTGVTCVALAYTSHTSI